MQVDRSDLQALVFIPLQSVMIKEMQVSTEEGYALVKAVGIFLHSSVETYLLVTTALEVNMPDFRHLISKFNSLFGKDFCF